MVSGSSSPWFSSPTHAASPATVLSMMNVAMRPEGSAAAAEEDERYAGNDHRPHLHLHHHQHHRNHSNDNNKHRDIGGNNKKMKDGATALPASERLRAQAPRLLRQIDGSDLFLRMKRIQIRPVHADGAEASSGAAAPATTASLSSSIELARAYPAFDQDEVIVGPMLGVGGFCSVYQVEKFCLKDVKEKDEASSSASMHAQQQQANATSEECDQHDDDDHHHQRDDDDSHGERFWSTAGGRAKRGGGGGGASVASTMSSCGSLSPSSSSSLHGHPIVNGDDDAAQLRPPRHVRRDPRHVMQQRARRRQVRQKEGGATKPSANPTDARYAIKRLHWDTLNDFERVRGSIDLAMEAKYLSALSHPNIGTCREMILGLRHRRFDCWWRIS
jgi:hypothetical protein